MKKNRILPVLVLLLLLMQLCCAFAEAPVCPVATPPAPDQLHTRWQLFTGEPVSYEITLSVDEETGLRTYTLHDPASWAIAGEAMGTWQYQAQGEAPGWLQTAQGGDGITLELPDEVYQEYGFLTFTVPCAAGADEISLKVYLGQLRKVYAFVDYRFGESRISIAAHDNSFALDLCAPRGDGTATLYASYDENGILAHAGFTLEAADGAYTSYNVEAIPALKEYKLMSIIHKTDETLLWENGRWMTDDYEKADAPEGISPENVPYTLVGGWEDIPFAQPGDLPEGVFPAAADTAAETAATGYRPWPEEEALYRDQRAAGAAPALPALTWETGEDGSRILTLTGPDSWGIRAEHQCDWRWNDAALEWEPEGDATPEQLRFHLTPATTSLEWRQACVDPALHVQLALSFDSLWQEMLLEHESGWYWQLDNQGSLIYQRPLTKGRTLTAQYVDGELLEYSILAADAEGDLLWEAVYTPENESSDVFSLRLFYHYDENAVNEALWLRDIGWYSYETGKPCECPEGVELEAYVPLELK